MATLPFQTAFLNVKEKALGNGWEGMEWIRLA